ncbi:hypothetical protein [Pseudomonas syringae]|uniref:hypothetical protein n=1 Tax=Pseudomonas syringae TaxID=317 RepID=UPI00165DA678|nr:hypothetical protein [Pseudomonas syringae]
MNDGQSIQNILNDIDEMLNFVNTLIDEKELKLNEPYKKIIYTYFRLFCTHIESLLILIHHNHLSSAILLLRAMLELFVKSFYFEFIEKKKGSSVEDFVSGKKDFPNFFMMTKSLEEYEHDSYGCFKGSFTQFTKNYLASYENFSFFSHGRGELLRAFYNNNAISYTAEQTSDVLMTAKGLFEQLSLLLFFTQGEADKVGITLKIIQKQKIISDEVHDASESIAE